MVGVHIGLHLEDEAGDLVAIRADLLVAGRLWTRRRRVAGDRVDQLGDAEILQGRTEIDRGEIALAESLEIEFRVTAARQLDLVGEALGDVRASVTRAKELARSAFGAADRAGSKIEDALELAAHADRPHLRGHIEREHISDLVERLEGIAALAVDLVDEGDDRHRAQAADFEQLAGLRLDAFRGVDHHHRRIHCGQRAVGIFREILVAWRVEQVEGDPVTCEGHHR